MFHKKKYFAIIDGERRGPFKLSRLAEAGVRPATYVWCKGMPDWEKAEDVPDVCRMFRNRIFDLMHPKSVDALAQPSPEEITPTQSGNSGAAPYPTRFDRYMEDGMHIPTIEELDEKENISIPPESTMLWAILVTIFFFPFTGIAAIVYSHLSRKAWKEGKQKAAHEYCRAAKMWTGVSFFLGVILYAFFWRQFG